MQTLDQLRSSRAYEQIARLPEAVSRRKAYGRMAHKLPVLIRQTGLAQALVFAEAKGGDGGSLLLAHLAEHLGDLGIVPEGTRPALMACVRSAELSEYIAITREVQAALLWYKRYAQSVLDVEQGEEDGGP